MKFYLFTLLILISMKLSAQIAAVETDEGTINSKVTDVVVVFKMHVDIGYTNWAEGVLQKYCNEMLDETLKSIEETSSLPKSEQFVWIYFFDKAFHFRSPIKNYLASPVTP